MNPDEQSASQSNQRKSYFDDDEFELDLTQENWFELAEAALSQAQAKHESILSSQAHLKYETIQSPPPAPRSYFEPEDLILIDDPDDQPVEYQGHSPHISISQSSSRSHQSSPHPPSQNSDLRLVTSPTTQLNEYGEQVLVAPCAIQPRTAWDMLYSHEEHPVLCTGLPELDRILRGGFRIGINEIVGEAGAAKSQLCFQLLLQVQLPSPPREHFLNPPLNPTTSDYGLDGCALYIGTEGEIPINRIGAMQRGMYGRVSWTQGYDYMSGIFPMRVQTMEELKSVLAQAEQTIVEKNIRLIVLDSIAGLLRVNENDEENHASLRVEGMFELAATLKRISTMYRCIVIVANQVTDRVRQEDTSGAVSINGSHYLDAYTTESSGRQVMPSLGISWASCVNTRLVLTRSGGARGHGESLTRSMSVMFSPHCRAKQSISFEVNEEGLA